MARTGIDASLLEFAKGVPLIPVPDALLPPGKGIRMTDPITGRVSVGVRISDLEIMANHFRSEAG